MRHLAWEGCFNVRDLGGLRARGGRVTRFGAVVRGDAPERLTPAGWAAIRAYGVRTIVDLRNDDERGMDVAPQGIDVAHVPLDGTEDREFWDEWEGGPQFGSPLYYGPFLERFPERAAAVVRAVARARPGGVLVHCVGGRDRTGLAGMLLLALAGVETDEIAADYALSAQRLRPYYASVGEEDFGEVVERYLDGEGTNAREVIVATLASLDVEDHLRAGGLGDRDIAAVGARLLARPASS